MRRWMMKLHLITGLLFGFFIAAIAATGSLLVLEEELESLFVPVPYQATEGSAPLESIRQQAKQAFPDYQIDRITPPGDEGLFQLRLTKQAEGQTLTKTIYSDPGSGQVLGEAKPRSAFYDYTLRLHRYLLLTDVVGRDAAGKIVGAIGIGFAVILLTGAVLWWPGLSRWAMGFKVMLHKGKLIFNQGLHKSVGVTVLVPLLILALTGAAFVFDRYVFDWLGIQRTVQPPADRLKVTAPPAGTAALPLDRLVETARTTYPDAEWVRITLPQKASQPVQIALKEGYTPNGNSNATLYLDPYTGQALWKTDPAAGVTLYQAWKSGLHFGRWGGLPVKLLYFAIGMMPLVLMISGLRIWRLKARIRSRSRAHAAGRRPARSSEAAG